MAKGKAKKINNKSKIYKIQNKKTNLWLYLTGNKPKISWGYLRYLADTFSIIKIEKLQLYFPEINEKECNFIEVDEKEIENDYKKVFKKK